MYTIHVDGKLLFSNAVDDAAHAVLSKKLELDVHGAGSLSFVLPPGNHLHGSIRKMKSIITVEENGAEIFRGRAVDVEKDTWNQRSVYCEGALSFLLDSVQSPSNFDVKAHTFLQNLITAHNEQVEEEKQFALGNVTAVAEDVKLQADGAQYKNVYVSTTDLINEHLVNTFGGYLSARHEGGVLYLDWLKELGGNEAKEIRFGVNLLDLKDKSDAGDMFTVLIPLGYSEIGSDGQYKAPVNIKSVNDGKDYIQDNEAVALYGKIWRTHTWAATKKPAELLEKAKAHLAVGAALRTLTIKAVDMHFIDGDASMIRIGQNVHIVSEPHGIDLEKACVKMSIDLENPENTTYTFGEKPRTFTESAARTEKKVSRLTGSGRGGGGRPSVEEAMEEIRRWAYVSVDQANANIKLNAGEINTLNGRVSEAEIEIDGINSTITLKADIVDVDAIKTSITNLTTGITQANVLSAGTMRANSAIIKGLTLGDDYISKKTYRHPTGIYLKPVYGKAITVDGITVTPMTGVSGNLVFASENDAMEYLGY